MKKAKKHIQTDLTTVAKACLRSYHISISLYHPSCNSLLPCILPPYDFSDFVSMDEELPIWLLQTLHSPEQSCLYTSPSNLTWMYLAIPDSICSDGRILSCTGIYLGPVFFSAPSQTFLKSHHMKEVCLPVIGLLEFTRLCHYLYALLTPDETKNFSYTLFQREYETVLTEDEMYFSQTRDYANVRFLEKTLVSLVKSGNTDGLENMMAHISLASPARLAADDLRDAKNRFIVTLMLVTRAAVDGGLPPEIAYPLSDIYLLENETLTSASQVTKFMMTAVFDYTRRVRDCQKYTSFCPLVQRCCSLILSNLNENLKINRLAAQLSVTPDHLSRKFKKETGQSILDYIQSQKTQEAARLLKYTNISLVSIAQRLGYNSQGQFTEKFKKSTGITPGKYRLSAQVLSPVPTP